MSKFTKMLPAGGFVIAVAMVCITSAFKDAPKSSTADSYFYEFVGDQTAENEVKNVANYHRADPGCEESSGDLCGINLPNDAAPNASPLVSDFTPHENNLWQSAQTGNSQEAVIEMKD